MKTPVFSIITVTFNAAQWLEKTIEAILEQTYPHIEYILIDGGSTDGTPEILQKYKDRISYQISEPDKGIYDAMNKGIRAATGDYLWFINAGDIPEEKETIEKIIASLPEDEEWPDILYGETCTINAEGTVTGARRLKAPAVLSWRSFRMGMLVCHQSFLVKRTLAPEYDLQYRLSADFDWCIRCLRQANTIHNTHQVLSRFLEEGISSSQRKKSLKERYRIMCNYYGTVPTLFRHLWFACRFYTAKWIKGKV